MRPEGPQSEDLLNSLEARLREASNEVASSWDRVEEFERKLKDRSLRVTKMQAEVNFLNAKYAKAEGNTRMLREEVGSLWAEIEYLIGRLEEKVFKLTKVELDLERSTRALISSIRELGRLKEEVRAAEKRN